MNIRGMDVPASTCIRSHRCGARLYASILLVLRWHGRACVEADRRERRASSAYAVSPDGQRFLLVKPKTENAPPQEVHVVPNWTEDPSIHVGDRRSHRIGNEKSALIIGRLRAIQVQTDLDRLFLTNRELGEADA